MDKSDKKTKDNEYLSNIKINKEDKSLNKKRKLSNSHNNTDLNASELDTNMENLNNKQKNEFSVSLSLSNKNNQELLINENNNLESKNIATVNTIKKTKHWEKKWILVPNVFDFTREIWLQKWCLIDDEPDYYNNNDNDNINGINSNNFESINLYENYLDNQCKTKDNIPKRYQCSFDECSKIFIDASSLKKHMLTHGERQYVCKHEGCGKKFLDNSKLRRHQLVHTGEKPFKCELCGKKFSLDFNLKTHLRTHTGEKPYFCSYAGCDKRFTQSSNLTAHEKTHKEAESAISNYNNENSNNVSFVNPNIISSC